MKPAALPCAIYTRKSSEEGLEQDFNSLDAQREACAAYILSQTMLVSFSPYGDVTGAYFSKAKGNSN